MLGSRDLAGRARDQHGKVLEGEPADLDAPTLGLRVELRSVGETYGCRPVALLVASSSTTVLTPSRLT
jgi:hypothetical protein